MTGKRKDSESIRRAFAKAQKVRRKHENELLAKANVIGVGVGMRKCEGVLTGEVGLVILVSNKLPASQIASSDLLPTEIDGVPVDVEQVGVLGVQASDPPV
jgi:hypothetical protein